jgi:hypothetical protein
MIGSNAAGSGALPHAKFSSRFNPLLAPRDVNWRNWPPRVFAHAALSLTLFTRRDLARARGAAGGPDALLR